MDMFNTGKVKKLEADMKIYRDRVKQLEAEVSELEGFRLKYKIAQMLVDDDPAIEELLTASKEKEPIDYMKAHNEAMRGEAASRRSYYSARLGLLGGSMSGLGGLGGGLM